MLGWMIGTSIGGRATTEGQMARGDGGDERWMTMGGRRRR